MAHSYSHLFGLPPPACGSSRSTDRGAGRTWRCSCSRERSSPASRSTVFNHGDDGARLHLHRRHRARRSSASWTAFRPESAWSGDAPDPGPSTAPYRLYNIGNHRAGEPAALDRGPRGLSRQEGDQDLLPMQPGDVPATCADVDDLARDVDFAPSHADRSRRRAVRALVPRVLPGLGGERRYRAHVRRAEATRSIVGPLRTSAASD